MLIGREINPIGINERIYNEIIWKCDISKSPKTRQCDIIINS